ncbi:MAG: hypothetical protein IJX14_09845, partial [Clostridia bacterium]|nr:hypothetical protein [Clostridia bacterium]
CCIFYHPAHSPLDDCIPFIEWFMIPYMFWFLYLVGIHIYTLLYDVDSFRRLIRFIIIYCHGNEQRRHNLSDVCDFLML